MSWIGNFFNRFLNNGFSPLGYTYNVFDALTGFERYNTDRIKLEAILSNPALLKVFSIQCDLFSQGKFYVYQNGKDIGNDPLLDKLKKPNPMQTGEQFKWDYMFWNMLGTAYLWIEDKGIESDYTKMYFLDSSKIEWPQDIIRITDKFVFKKETERENGKKEVTYRFNDGTTKKIPLKDIIIMPDLTNGLGNWYKSPSRIDALYKVISNSEAALDAKNINVRYSGKFMVAGKHNPDLDLEGTPMAEDEKRDIETKVNGDTPKHNKPVHAVKSMIDIKRFVEDINKLKLDDSYIADYFIIGTMFNIPKDVLEAYNSGKGATYENQEKAIGRHIGYSLQPKADALCNAINTKFGYTNKELVIGYDHLPYMMVFEKDKADTNKVKAETLKILLESGVSIEDINREMDTNFTVNGKEQSK